MLRSTRRLHLLDESRVPYEVVAGAGGGGGTRADYWLSGSADDTPPRLHWLVPAGGDSTVATGAFWLDGVPIFGDVVRAEFELRWLADGWRRAQPVTDRSGQAVTHVLQHDDGSLLLPFDPDEIFAAYLSERSIALSTRKEVGALLAAARWTYYRLRPALPRRLQLVMRRRFARVQGRSAFPRWPEEPAAHDFREWLWKCVLSVAEDPVPTIGWWPDGSSWAFVLTHDVETAKGLRDLPLLRAIEVRRGQRSAWNFVAKRYEVDAAQVAQLVAEGCEIGVHGLYHDGRDLESPAVLNRRLPEMLAHARSWGADGFRAPALQRSEAVVRMLPFGHDSSYPDTDPFEAVPGGCASWLPFQIGDLVELPVTVPQDFTLFELLGRREPSEWFTKTAYLRERGGMALIITHPDYMAVPERLASYDRWLGEFGEDPTAWCALPREVADWWRRRAASVLERNGEGWRVVGPAASRAVVELREPLPRPPVTPYDA